jgi:hypothetical protein
MFLIISGDAACLYVILFYSIINLVQNLNTYDIKKQKTKMHSLCMVGLKYSGDESEYACRFS